MWLQCKRHSTEGAPFAYTQAWFGGQVQKIVSTAAALATSKFNRLRPEVETLALFVGRTHHPDESRTCWNTCDGGIPTR
jgi:hypothetical protein